MRIARSTSFLLVAIPLLAACSQPQATDETLRDSFVERLATSDFVSDLARDGDVIRFTGPSPAEGMVSWEVRIDTSLVEPNERDEKMPWVGRVTSEWSAGGEVVEYLGNMTALPEPFLERGLGQECWAYWIEAEHRWDW